MNTPSLFDIRSATPEDAGAVVAIYNHYILHTFVSFEEVPLEEKEMLERMASVWQAGLPWLVAEQNGQLRGYAYAAPWRSRAAYRHSVETSVYLDHRYAGMGLGSGLMSTLLDELATRPVHCVTAGIALPNPASVALHEKLGMQQVSHHHEVGYKHGEWIDVGYWELLLPMEHSG